MKHYQNLPIENLSIENLSRDKLSEGIDELLAETYFLNTQHPQVRAFTEAALGLPLDRAQLMPETERAIKLFYAVRDQVRYDPYRISLADRDYQAHEVLNCGYGWCISKAALLATVLRAAHIPSAIGLADVVNHLTTDKLRERMGGVTTFYNHGYVALKLNQQWFKAVPAFNIELCERFGVKPTEFDGRSNALYQEYDQSNRLHMEYQADHGTWSDLPMAKIRDELRANYPGSAMIREIDEAALGRFEEDAPLK